MNRSQLVGIYDEEYAANYNVRFLLDSWPKHGADFELSVVRDNVPEDGRWLDVGCGTGWFLSQLPEVTRAGFDLSPAMVAQARAANPDALFIEERSFLDGNPEWDGQWDLVSCIWQPYHYVDSVWQVEQLVENMAAWTAPGGAAFIPLLDLEDIRPGVDLPYEEHPEVWGGTIALTSITWTWDEPGTGKRHEHSVAPQAGHFVKIFEPHFTKVEILRYPPFEKNGVSRKAILGTGRRTPGDTSPAQVVWHPRPDHPDEVAEREAAAAAAEAERQAELARIEREEAQRADAVRRAEAEARETADKLAEAERILAVQAEAESHPPHVCPPATSAEPLTTGALVKELLRRASPSDGRLWRSAARGVTDKLRRSPRGRQ